MSDFSLMGGIGIMGVLTPMDTRDTYAVVDPIYGIDGLRNVNTINDLNIIPETRRRSGMIVGVNGGETYYKLKDIQWEFDLTDWEELTLKIQYIDKESPVGVIDGINKEFILEYSPEINSEHIFLNGILQESGDIYDYTILGNVISFIDAPPIGSRIRCSYRYK